MHRRIVAVYVMIVLILLSGCSGKGREQEEGLMELTDLTESRDSEAEEIQEEAAIKGTKEEAAAERTKEEEQEEPTQDGEATAGDTAEIYVHVCGQVVSPGVYKLPAGSRMFEAVEAAGGLTENAADELLNQAAQAQDGQQIYVPSKEEASQGMPLCVSNSGVEGQNMPDSFATGSRPAQGNGQTADDGKINLNTASKEQLMTLSGIGEAKANSIIAYREAHGGFQKIEDLMKVEGIKEGVFNKVKDQIKVS